MPLPVMLVPAIAGALVTVATSVVARVVMALGLAAVSYVGLHAALGYFQSQFVTAMGGAGATLAGMCGVLKLDAVLAIFTAAALAKLAIAGASSGAVKKLVMK